MTLSHDKKTDYECIADVGSNIEVVLVSSLFIGDLKVPSYGCLITCQENLMNLNGNRHGESATHQTTGITVGLWKLSMLPQLRSMLIFKIQRFDQLHKS